MRGSALAGITRISSPASIHSTSSPGRIWYFVSNGFRYRYLKFGRHATHAATLAETNFVSTGFIAYEQYVRCAERTILVANFTSRTSNVDDDGLIIVML